MERIRVELDPTEYRGLVRLCEEELRPVPDELRHLLRAALKERGYLPPDHGSTTPAPGVPESAGTAR